MASKRIADIIPPVVTAQDAFLLYGDQGLKDFIRRDIQDGLLAVIKERLSLTPEQERAWEDAWADRARERA